MGLDMNKRIFRLLGCILIVWGICICFIPIYFSSRFGVTFNFTGFNIPLGLVIAALGAFIVWSTFSK